MMRPLVMVGLLAAAIRLFQLASVGQLASDTTVWVVVAMCWMIILCLEVDE